MKKNEVRVTPFTLADEVYFQEAAGLLEINFPEAYEGEGLLELEKCLAKDRVALKALLMVTLETALYRYMLSFVRATAFIGYKKKKNVWGEIQRKKQNYT